MGLERIPNYPGAIDRAEVAAFKLWDGGDIHRISVTLKSGGSVSLDFDDEEHRKEAARWLAHDH